MTQNRNTRRSFLASFAGVTAATMLSPFDRLFAAEKGKVRIADIKTMVIQGTTTPYYERQDLYAG